MLTLIVDGQNLAHRCRHTFSLSSNGVDTSVTYGFLRTLHTIMLRYAPDVVVVCWDGGVPEYRRKYCPTYKNRDRSEDDTYEEFMAQVIELQDILPSFGVTSVRKVGAEADDLMYQTALLLTGNKIIMTTDQDLYQAVLSVDDVTVYSPTKDLEITKANFEEVTGVEPDWGTWMTYRAMVGDSSDGIPGAHGIGPKFALNTIKLCGGSPSAIINIANGKGDPELKLSVSTATKLGMFGISGFQNAYKVARLDHDLIGSRQALLDEFANWQPYDHHEVKDFLMYYIMTSLQEPEFYKSFRLLQSPQEVLTDEIGTSLPIPIVAPAREALDASGGQLGDD